MNLIKQTEDFFSKVINLKIAVIGETIVDEFIDVEYEGRSMKSSCPALRLNGKKEIQQGGATVIANHLKDFVKDVKLITNTNKEIIKTRYVESYNKQKHIEINKFYIDNFGPIDIDTSEYDIVIVSDFGHKFCDNLNINDGFYLMCQTNSNNFGFNRISKWKTHKKKAVCIDKREASLQINQRLDFNNKNEIFKLYNYELNSQNLFITLGKQGSIFTNGNEIIREPIYKSQVIDTIGAGDTFFAFSCLASHIKNDLENILTIPSLAASLSTTWNCNAEYVTKQKLLDYANKFVQ